MREIEALRREKEDRERELEAENSALVDESRRLRAELDAVMRELQNIMNTKMSLEMEIAAYRKLLESEENRFPFTFAVSHIRLISEWSNWLISLTCASRHVCGRSSVV